MLALFTSYPHLRKRLPHVELGVFPTPVERLTLPGHSETLPQAFIKRDDVSGALYGGNKIRKLEFLLGAAQQQRARCVLTAGFAGSNHTLATALYARQMGLPTSVLLLPQVNARVVRLNLLATRCCQSEIHAYRNIFSLMLGSIAIHARKIFKYGKRPFVIPVGGSNPPGVIGYVNAAFELREQIAAGLLPEPDLIYVALGSGGTAAGLLLGMRVAGLGSRIKAIRIVDENLSRAAHVLQQLNKAAALLHKLDPHFPLHRFSRNDLDISNEFLGPGYGRFTAASQQAAALLEQATGLPASGAYTAKVFAALLSDASGGALRNKTVLFWNTFNSRDLTQMVGCTNYEQLPQTLHCYFKEAVQPYDHPSGSG